MSYTIKSILLLNNNKTYNIVIQHAENSYLYSFSFNYTSENKIKLNNFINDIKKGSEACMTLTDEKMKIHFDCDILSLETLNTIFLVQITSEKLIDTIKII